MTEILGQIRDAAKKVLDGKQPDIFRAMHRHVIVDTEDGDIYLDQRKLVASHELGHVSTKGALALATTEWFSCVDLAGGMQQDNDGLRYLNLEASYPLYYFDEEPVAGTFVEEDGELRWVDRYSAVASAESSIGNIIQLGFVIPGERAIASLSYPDGLDAYNARYQMYLDDLNKASPTISYYRSWEKPFSLDKDRPLKAIGGVSLISLSLKEIIDNGGFAPENNEDTLRLVFSLEPGHDGYIARDLVVAGNTASTELYWDAEDDREPASDELLATALELADELSEIRNSSP